jgi:hypothetical protein
MSPPMGMHRRNSKSSRPVEACVFPQFQVLSSGTEIKPDAGETFDAIGTNTRAWTNEFSSLPNLHQDQYALYFVTNVPIAGLYKC